MPGRTLASALSLLLAAAPALAQAPAAGLTRIGAAAAVAGAVKATAPGQAVGRVIGSGKPMYLNDHVTTDAAGHLQVLLLDETVFTLGPNSDMVLDEFVYDPNTSAGRVSASIAKGTFRFISGKIAHNAATDNVKIKLPVGTMGIRGTIGAGEIDAGHSTIILAGPGAHNNAGENPGSISLTNGGSTVVLDRPGFGATMLPGQPPTPPADMSGRLGGLMGELGSTHGSGHVCGAGSAPGSNQAAAGAVGNGGPVGQTSGQNTAAGGALASDTSDAGQVASAVNTVGTQATQDNSNVIVDGLSTWEQIANIPQTTGVQQWSGSGSFSCSGGTCGNSAVSGTLDFTLVVDWGGRTLGGNTSSVSMGSAGSFTGASASINQFAMPTSGSSIVTLAGSNITNSAFTGTTINLLNGGGIIARDAQINLNYSGGGGETAGGSVTSTPRGPYQPPQ